MDIIERLEHPKTLDDLMVSVDDAIAEIKRLRALTAWRPISEAPKDGNPIILGYSDFGGLSSAEGYWMGDPKRNYWGETGWFESSEEVFHTHPSSPTHYMPLPEPPGQGE